MLSEGGGGGIRGGLGVRLEDCEGAWGTAEV